MACASKTLFWGWALRCVKGNGGEAQHRYLGSVRSVRETETGEGAEVRERSVENAETKQGSQGSRGKAYNTPGRSLERDARKEC